MNGFGGRGSIMLGVGGAGGPGADSVIAIARGGDSVTYANAVIPREIAGLSVQVSDHAPAPRDPTPGEDARRMVRHGMADVLAWLGQPVGPKPGELVYTALVFDPNQAAIVDGIRAGAPARLRTVLMHPDCLGRLDVTRVEGAL